MPISRICKFEAPTALELRNALEFHAEYGPGAPALVYVYADDKLVTGLTITSEKLSDGTSAYRINLHLE